MLKIKGTIDRFESEKAVLRANGEDLIIPKKMLKGFSEGDSVSVVISDEKEDTESAEAVAKALVTDLFKEE